MRPKEDVSVTIPTGTFLSGWCNPSSSAAAHARCAGAWSTKPCCCPRCQHPQFLEFQSRQEAAAA